MNIKYHINKDVRSVLVLTTSYPLFEGIAVGIHVHEKCRHLVASGLKVRVIAPHHAGAKHREIIDGVEVRRFCYFFPKNFQKVAYGAGIPTNLRRSLLSRLQLPLFLIAFFFATVKNVIHFDLIHCHWSLAGLIAVFVKQLFSKPVVFMMHGAEVFVLGNHPLLRFILKRIDYLISNSSFTERKSLDIYPVKNHSIISPGVNISRFYPQSRIPKLRSSLNINNNDFFILSIGKFIPRKGFEYLIKSLNILINQRNEGNIKLKIGGRGPLKTEYERLINLYDLEHYVGFLDYIPDEDIPSYFTEADVFVLPSIIDERGDTEGLGVVFLEANACGTPVIGTSVGGIVDAIDHEVNGLQVEPKNAEALANAIHLMKTDPDLRNLLGEKGLERVHKYFNWEAISKEILHVYNKLL